MRPILPQRILYNCICFFIVVVCVDNLHHAYRKGILCTRSIHLTFQRRNVDIVCACCRYLVRTCSASNVYYTHNSNPTLRSICVNVLTNAVLDIHDHGVLRFNELHAGLCNTWKGFNAVPVTQYARVSGIPYVHTRHNCI